MVAVLVLRSMSHKKSNPPVARNLNEKVHELGAKLMKENFSFDLLNLARLHVGYLEVQEASSRYLEVQEARCWYLEVQETRCWYLEVQEASCWYLEV